MLGDYAIIKYPDSRGPYRIVQILNWRTSSSTRHAKSTLTSEFKLATVRFDFRRTPFAKVLLKAIRLLPENKIFAIQDYSRVAIYRIPEFRWTKPLEVSPADGHLQQPIWTAWLDPQAQIYSRLSKPSYGPFDTRLSFTHNDQIYGLVIPHHGRTPALHVLATAPGLSKLMRATMVIVLIDKIYGEREDYGLKASMLTYSWPEEADLAQPTAWVPPTLHFTHKQFAGHHTSVMRGNDLVDDVSGRVVTGSKYETVGDEIPEEVDGVEWSDIICWSVVDFFHPQF
jgi:hypothetical protein